MAIDYCVGFECAPKRHFGNGDIPTGTLTILDLLKDANRARAMAEYARQHGQDPATMTVTVQGHDWDGAPVERTVTVAELAANAKPLEDQAGPCANCPANVLKKPYGCYGAINYPISAEGENWLLGRLQPHGTFGSNLFQSFVRDFDISGDHVRALRKDGLFENPKSQRITLKKGFVRAVFVEADELMEALFWMEGDAYGPDLCMSLLLFLGAIEVDGEVPGDPEQHRKRLETLKAVANNPSTIPKHARPNIGADHPSLGVQAMQTYLKALYTAWHLNTILIISA